MLPIGSANLATAALILALKLYMLPRALPMPAFFCYLVASIVTTSAYILGWGLTEAAWLPSVAVLGVAAAVECTRWTLGLQSDEERAAVSKWCVLLGLVCGAIWFAADGAIYPHYLAIAYQVRIVSALVSVGYLVGLLGHCFVVGSGVTRYVIHASILLLRLFVMGALLLVPHQHWFAGDLAGSLVNALTLGGWLFLIPSRQRIVV